MSRRRVPAPENDDAGVDEALAAMGADDLRGIIRGILPWLGPENQARLVSAVIDRGQDPRQMLEQLLVSGLCALDHDGLDPCAVGRIDSGLPYDDFLLLRIHPEPQPQAYRLP